MVTATINEATIRMVPIGRLKPHVSNPRGKVEPETVHELADSIREQGVLQPILTNQRYVVVAGHRRLAAAQLAGLTEVPVIVRTLSPRDELAIMIAENVQRDDLNPLQEARAYKQLLATGITVAEVCRQVGVPPFRVNSRLVLLKLDPQVQLMFVRNQLPLMMAGVLVKIGDPNRQRQLALMADRRRLTVSQLQAIVNRGETKTAPTPVKSSPSHRSVRNKTGSKIRQTALDQLVRKNATRTAESIAAAVNECCAIDCRMMSQALICDSCPIPQLVRRLA